MTTLALLELNPRSRACRRDLHNPQAIHRTIMSMYPQSPSRSARGEFGVLWRIERGESPTLLVQSAVPPDPAELPDGYANASVRCLDAHLDALDAGGLVDYRAVLNPVRTSRRRNRPAAQQVVPFADRGEWWEAKAAKAGLETLDAPAITTEPARKVNRNHAGPAFPLYAFRADGKARITDPEALRDAIRAGIGPAKAWGCGLLTVIRAGHAADNR